MAEELCRLCGQARELIDAHIIAEGWFRRLAKNGGPNRLLNREDYPKKSRTGIYDKRILCAPCDGIFSPWENYAQSILMPDSVGLSPIPATGEPVGFVRNEFDYRSLKLFFISLIWRASVSTHPFFENVNLGPLEEHARSLLLARDPGDPQDFAVLLQRFDNGIAEAIFEPISERISGVRAYVFYLGGFRVHIKASKQRIDNPLLSQFLVGAEASLKIIVKSFFHSDESRLMANIINAPQNRLRSRQ